MAGLVWSIIIHNKRMEVATHFSRSFMLRVEQLGIGGKTYVYTRKDANHYWEEVGIIDAPKPDSIYFGDQVALSGSNVVVASRDNSYAYDLKACRV